MFFSEKSVLEILALYIVSFELLLLGRYFFPKDMDFESVTIVLATVLSTVGILMLLCVCLFVEIYCRWWKGNRQVGKIFHNTVVDKIIRTRF